MERLTKGLEAKQVFSDADFLEVYEGGGSDRVMGKALGVSHEAIHKRRMRFALPANKGGGISKADCIANIEMNRKCTKRHREAFPKMYKDYRVRWSKWHKKHPKQSLKLSRFKRAGGKGF